MSAAMSEAAIWHELECGGYTADLDLWRALADRLDGFVLDIGAGTGRTALHLAAAGHAVMALDLDDALLQVLRERAAGLEVVTVVGDARSFDLGTQFALIIVPMQTVQLLGGPEARAQFFECAQMHLAEGGRVAIAVADQLELFEVPEGAPGPLPDVREIDGVVYCSRPTAVRTDGEGFQLERRRERVTAGGEMTVETDLIHLDSVDPDTLEAEALQAGLRSAGRIEIPATEEHVGSTVVVLRG